MLKAYYIKINRSYMCKYVHTHKTLKRLNMLDKTNTYRPGSLPKQSCRVQLI